MRFWRNVTLIAVAHAIALIALLRWAGNTKAASAEEITWLSGVETSEAGAGESSSTPEVSRSQDSAQERLDSETTPTPSSEIVLPKPISTPSPPVTPSPPRKKPAVRPSATPKKKAAPKPSASPAKAKAEVASRKKQEIASSARRKTGKTSTTPSSGVGGNAGSGGGAKLDAATAKYYSNMLHDRFYRAWDQPQTVVASGARFSAVARIRIEKDGRVSDFRIVQPSGNVLVDESVAAAGKKVTQVDALPAGIGSAGRYDVNVSFELNPN